MPSIRTNFSFKDSDIEKIKQAIINVGVTSERVVNNYLHNVAGKNITERITNYIPHSPRKNVIHAKNSKWSEQENFNLAIKIGNSLKGSRGKSFYYLYYVVTGTGTSYKKGARDFMEEGLNAEYENVVNGIVNELSKNIEKELKV